MRTEYIPSALFSEIAWSSDATHTCLTPCPTVGEGKADMSGINNTAALLDPDHLEDGHTHPAAQAAADYAVPTPPGASGWFLPSYGQWIKALASYVGYGDSLLDLGEGGTSISYNRFKNDLLDAGTSDYISSRMINFYFWTSTEYDEGNAMLVASKSQNMFGLGYSPKNDAGSSMNVKNVRPFFAF